MSFDLRIDAVYSFRSRLAVSQLIQIVSILDQFDD